MEDFVDQNNINNTPRHNTFIKETGNFPLCQNYNCHIYEERLIWSQFKDAID